LFLLLRTPLLKDLSLTLGVGMPRRTDAEYLPATDGTDYEQHG